MRDQPKIVYKYRDWNNHLHKRILLYNEVYLSPPDDFNDPFDCEIYTNFLLLKEDEKEEFIRKVTIRHYDQLVKDGKNIENEMLRLENKLKNLKSFQLDCEEIERDFPQLKREHILAALSFAAKREASLRLIHI